MVNARLDEFVVANRDELIRRCRDKVAGRSAPSSAAPDTNHGVPMFLDQLVEELRHGPSTSNEISASALKHGQDLLRQGFSVGQVVHNYGDVCQSVTDLAVEMTTRITTDDFRTLNRCLDNAIAGAVTQYARGEAVTRVGTEGEIRDLVRTAKTAFEVLQTGTVGVAGKTGAVVYRSLDAINAILDRQRAKTAGPEAV
jgi:hypothetical protein